MRGSKSDPTVSFGPEKVTRKRCDLDMVRAWLSLPRAHAPIYSMALPLAHQNGAYPGPLTRNVADLLLGPDEQDRPCVWLLAACPPRPCAPGARSADL